MQKNLYNLSNPQKEINEHHPKKVLTWVIIVLVIIGAGFLVYKKFGNREYSLDQKIDVLNSMDSGDNTVPKEEKDRVLEELNNQNTNTYTDEQKLDVLNNL